jgi:hypothetical protein
MLKKITLLLLLLIAPSLSASSKAGQFYFYWGWNHSSYTNSDINFKGDSHNFTLYDVAASDKQSDLGLGYINPLEPWVPQYNTRIGYYLDDKHAISFGLDHMKYFVNQEQWVRIEGEIDNSRSNKYAGTYDGSSLIQTNKDFLDFEHSDGLNYFSFDLESYDQMFVSQNVDLSLYWGIGAGFVIPKSNVQLLDGKRNDEFHLAGYGASFKAGSELTLYKSYFMRLAMKRGYINMYDVLTSPDASDKAEHDFEFTEGYIVFGLNF